VTLATLVSVVKTVIAFEMMLSSRSYVELVAPRDSWQMMGPLPMVLFVDAFVIICDRKGLEGRLWNLAPVRVAYG